ncbi:MerR family transcriptional regulator [Pseudonocardia sp. KRD291]|uniref:MerR family transcriptional regulator n=1 Tax=Pseudonocardia sp. KRD291 TaxID=2792007 RepID=UPI001C49FE3C|nr:MerR family transcriptional regulator [Pseudonocardia sp. KRD291]MBW0105477.1 MerR family transcriptional regulator [Pseudonocardia sp. KRD291]
MQIGEAANRVGLSLRTMRHWDEVGLAVPSARSVGGFRLYTEADLERLLVIKTFKPLELSLEQMRELLATMDAVAANAAGAGEGDVEAADVLLERLTMFQAVTDSRIEALRAQAQSLETLSRELRRLATDGARAR